MHFSDAGFRCVAGGRRRTFILQKGIDFKVHLRKRFVPEVKVNLLHEKKTMSISKLTFPLFLLGLIP